MWSLGTYAVSSKGMVMLLMTSLFIVTPTVGACN